MSTSNFRVVERSDSSAAQYSQETPDIEEALQEQAVAGAPTYAPVAPAALPVRLTLLSRVLHRTMQALMDGAKRLEGMALLRNFRSTWYTTSVGHVHTMEFGRPDPGRPSWVFIHGYAARAVDWGHLLRRMSQRCGHIVAIDLPGHGRSPLPFAGQAAMTEANLLRVLRETLTLSTGTAQQAVVVGNSTGGMGAVRLAQALGRERVPYLVLISPLGSPMSGIEVDTVLQMFHVENFKQGLAFVDRLFVNGSKMRLINALGVWSHLKRPHLRHFADQLRTCPFLQPEELQAMPPTLLIWGDADKILPMSGRDFFSRHLPQHELVAAPNYSHAPFMDLGDDVAQDILKWADAQDGIWGT